MNILYPLIEDRAWATDRIIKLEKENAELRRENKELRVAVKAAYIEAWSEGHNEGIGCGHALAPRCKHKASIEWLDSEALEELKNA